jgi:F-type H+-transporting ATPase subunit delta
MPQDPSAQDAHFAVERDPGRGRLAAEYAEGLLGAAENESCIDALLIEFHDFVGNVLDAHPRFEAVLVSALVSHEDREAILDRILRSKSLDEQASPTFLNFLKVVSKHERLDLLRSILREYRSKVDSRLGRIPITVTTAVPIKEATALKIVDGLREFVEGEPVMRLVVDPNVLGGIVVRVGDTVFDASTASHLENARRRIIDRSVHEISIRRDRFSDPTGN